MKLYGLVIVLCFGSILPAAMAASATQSTSIPDFAVAEGWRADRPILLPSPTGPRPVGIDPVIYDKAHPFNPYACDAPIIALRHRGLAEL
jgi:hypothetical protein